MMKMSEKSRDGLDQLGACVTIMQERQFELDCLINQVESKKKWIEERRLKVEEKKQLIQEDCEFLEHQNQILQDRNAEGVKQEQKTERSELQQIL